MIRSRVHRFVWVLMLMACPSQLAASELCVTENDNSTQLALCGSEPFRSTESAVTDARLIRVPESDVLLILWNETAGEDASVPFYAVSLDGLNVVRVRQTSYDLQLKVGHFDPAVETPQMDQSLTADESNELYIVQFVTQPLDALHTGLGNAAMGLNGIGACHRGMNRV